MHKIVLIAVQLALEAAVWRGSEKYVFTIWREKPIPAEKFIFKLGCSLQACNVDKNELAHGYFSVIFIGYFS